MIVINDTLSAYGGSHTMMQRMCCWLSKNCIPSAILSKKDTNTEIVTQIKSYGTQIYLIDVKDTAKTSALLKKLQKSEGEIKTIAFSLNMYLDLEKAKAFSGLEFDNILYCIQSESLKKGLGFKTKIMRYYSKKKYGSIISRINENQALLMMDEYCIEQTIGYMGPIFRTYPQIVRLPMECMAMDDCKEIISNGYKSRTIMTAARAEFPNKGYIIGLLDEFVRLKEKYDDIKLEIIAAGENISELLVKIDTLAESCRKDINIRSWMSYNLLLEEMKKCTLFIGMGSSVLDAALQYKPAAAAKGYTYEYICPYLICDEPRYVIAPSVSMVPAFNIIEKVLLLNFTEYRDICFRCYNAVEETYNIDKIMATFLKHASLDKKCLLTNQERMLHWLNNILNSIRFRKDSFDYNSIKK